MDALNLLLNRRSVPRLAAPKPEGEALQNIILAGLRAPDHGGLQPWRFSVICDAGLDRLSDLLLKAAVSSGSDAAAQEKARQAPYRAPLIIAVIAKCQKHPKVPEWEQIVSAGCAVQAMQMAAVAQGFGGIWRTGPMTEDPLVKAAFDCGEQDSIVGFLYLGTPMTTPPALKAPDTAPFLSYF